MNQNAEPKNVSIAHDGHDIDRFGADALSEAYGIIEQYSSLDHGYAPRTKIAFHEIAERQCDARGIDTDSANFPRWERNIAVNIAKRCTDKETKIGFNPVALDLSGEHGFYGHLAWDVPSIAFCYLDLDKDVTLQSFAPAEWNGIAGIAVYFDPMALVDDPENENGFIKRSSRLYKPHTAAKMQAIIAQADASGGESSSTDSGIRFALNRDGDLVVERPNEYHAAGWSSIVGIYADFDAIDDAQRDLNNALWTIRKSVTDSAMNVDTDRSLDTAHSSYRDDMPDGM